MAIHHSKRLRTKKSKKIAPSSPNQSVLRMFESLRTAICQIPGAHADRTLSFCPKGIIEDVIKIVATQTDLPPEIAFFAFMNKMGAALTQNKFLVAFPDGQKMPPNLWNICLAISGAGKTLSQSAIVEPITAMASVVRMPQTLTAAAMFAFFESKNMNENIRFQRCRAQFCRDEFGELMRLMKKDGGDELRDLLLRTFDGGKLTRATKKDGECETEETYISVFGTSVDTTFFSNIEENDFENGLMQRFMLSLCHSRPAWRKSFYSLKNETIRASIKFCGVWDAAIAGGRNYTVTDGAMRAYDDWFQKRWVSMPDKESYFRRYAWSTFKYALIFKALTNPNGLVEESELLLALRVTDQHLVDLHRCISEYTAVDDWHRIYLKVFHYLRDHPTCTRSNVLSNVRGANRSDYLDKYLETIIDIYPDCTIAIHAKKLKDQARR